MILSILLWTHFIPMTSILIFLLSSALICHFYREFYQIHWGKFVIVFSIFTFYLGICIYGIGYS